MIIYGKQLFLYLLEKKPDVIDEVYLSKEIDKKLFSRIVKIGKKIIKVDNKKAQALAKGGNHQGFFMKMKDIELENLSDLKKENFLLVLYSVTDVGNIGAIIRSAYAFGVGGIILTGIKNINLEAVARTSSGAIFDMPLVLIYNELDVMNELKLSGFSIYGADMDGTDIREVRFPEKKAVFLGSEGKGLSKRLSAALDKKISIKMTREFDSLNVSAACAVMCDRIANG